MKTLYNMNAPQYRLGDAVLFPETNWGEHARNQILSNPDLFKDSLAYEYLSKVKDNNYIFDKKIFTLSLEKYSKNLGINSAKKDQLCIHLRMGDSKAFRGSLDSIVNYVSSLIKESGSIINSVKLITALHFGKNFLVRTTNELYLKRIRESFNLISSFGFKLKELGVRVILPGLDQDLIMSGEGLAERADKDLCKLYCSSFLILGEGHFSLCAGLVSKGKVFIPPWVENPDASIYMKQLFEKR
jgi:hypothetical protein